MGKGKHNQKPKPNKQKQQHPKNRKQRSGLKQNDESELRAHLDLLGLKIITVTSDGNCLFRSLADQLEGSEDEYDKYRIMVVKFIKDNQEMFEPFIEDEVPFDQYCQLMEEDGTWAGNLELQAASLVTHSNICIHRHMSPRYYILNFDKQEAKMIHLSYHDGQHYNSVRSKEDTCSGPARPIIIKGDVEISAKSNQPKVDTVKSNQETRGNVVHEGSIKSVKAGSGCEDAKKIEQILRHVGGDVDAAIEILISEQISIDQIVADDEFSDSVKNSNGRYLDDHSELDNINIENNTTNQDLSGDETERTKRNLQLDEKKIPKNKACPCGSKKKYKSCCGTVAGKSLSRLPAYQTVDYGKGRKERKQGRKNGSTFVNSSQSNGGPLDMGALCI